MRKISILVLVLFLLLPWGMSCSKKKAGETAPTAPTKATPAATRTLSPEMGAFNRWAIQLRVDLKKRGGEGKIRNIALPGEKLGERIAVMTADFSDQGKKDLAKFIGDHFKKNFPEKSSTVEVYENGKMILQHKVK